MILLGKHSEDTLPAIQKHILANIIHCSNVCKIQWKKKWSFAKEWLNKLWDIHMTGILSICRKRLISKSLRYCQAEKANFHIIHRSERVVGSGHRGGDCAGQGLQQGQQCCAFPVAAGILKKRCTSSPWIPNIQWSDQHHWFWWMCHYK